MSIAHVLNDIYYTYANVHAFTTFELLSLKSARIASTIIDRWQYEEGQCTITINNPTQYIYRVPHNHVIIVVACPAHILLRKKGIEMKLGI